MRHFSKNQRWVLDIEKSKNFELMDWMIISNIVKEELSFKVYTHGVFAYVVLILGQDDPAVIGYI